jgi:hypothetical protein
MASEARDEQLQSTCIDCAQCPLRRARGSQRVIEGSANGERGTLLSGWAIRCRPLICRRACL